MQVLPDHYMSVEYLEPLRFLSLGHQVAETMATRAESILEIGVGNGSFKAVMCCLGVDVTTVDIDPRLGPDIVSDVTKLALSDACFDAVCAFQILEHLQFKDFPHSIAQLARVARHWVVISLPDSRKSYRILIDLGVLGIYQQRQFTIDRAKDEVPGCHQHYWEIGLAGVRLRDVVNILENNNLRLLKHYRIFCHPYHHVFVLRKG